jgi:CheY-like chemotaxis protein
MGGRIEVQSPAISRRSVHGLESGDTSTGGPGSTFSFTSSFGVQAMKTISTPAQHLGLPVLITPLANSLARMHILLAEDNAVNQRLIVRLLEKRGHSIVVAHDGRQALDLLEHQHFDLVLMDVQMPELNGFEVTTAIRQKELETGEHLPIVALTAHAMKGDQELCFAAGMDAYLSKPIQSADLFETIGRFVSPGIVEGVSSH